MSDEAIRHHNIIARIERLPFHFWHVKMRMIVGVATFFDAVDAVMIAYILPVLIPLWNITPTRIGILISIGYGGQLLGSFFFGWFAERRGRVCSLVFSVIVFSIASFLCVFSWCYWSLFLFRFVQGFGLGGEVPVAAAYINELAKAEGRGRFVLLYELIFAVGLVISALMGWWIVPGLGWRVMFLIGAIPALMVPLFLRKLPESPRWLACQKRFDEAEKIVDMIEAIVSEKGRNNLPPVHMAGCGTQIKDRNWRELFQGIYLRRTLTVWVIWFCGFFCNFGLVTWLPTLYTSVYHLPLDRALWYSLVTSIAGLCGTATCAFLIDKLGRKVWFTGAFLGAAIFLVLLWQQGKASAEVLLALTSLSYYFIGSISVALWLYTPEIYPTRIRALGSGLGTVWYRIATAIAPLLVGLIVMRYSLSHAFAMFAITAFFGAVITGIFAIETKGRVLEEISP